MAYGLLIGSVRSRWHFHYVVTFWFITTWVKRFFLQLMFYYSHTTVYSLNKILLLTCCNYCILFHNVKYLPPDPLLVSHLLSLWRTLRSYRPLLKLRDPIWGDYWSHNLHQTVSKRKVDVRTNYHPIITLSLVDVSNWCCTRRKCPLARNPN